MTIELNLIYYKFMIKNNPFGDCMEEYFLFDVKGNFTGKSILTSEEGYDALLEEVRRVTKEMVDEYYFPTEEDEEHTL